MPEFFKLDISKNVLTLGRICVLVCLMADIIKDQRKNGSIERGDFRRLIRCDER